ncbi:MAG: ornithine cyclodeaminase family protein [Rhodospirillales bacterium]|nr:ornithine cyclodeaminase family protein [Rhodospirillales bacterium]
MTLFLNNDHIAQVLDMGMAIDVLEDAYRDYGKGSATCVPRVDVQIPTGSSGKTYQFGTTIGGSTDKYLAMRIKSDVMFEEESDGLRRKGKYCVEPGLYCGLVFLFSVENGEPLAILNDGLLQKARVGADSAIGVKYMAREDSSVLGMLGSGGMARMHLDAFIKVRPIRKMKVYSPTPENRKAFANEAEKKYGIEAIAVNDPNEIYSGADIVAACTNVIGPVVQGKCLEQGTHVISIGGTLDQAASSRIDVSLRFGNAPAPQERPDFVVTEECLTYVAESAGKVSYGGTKKFSNIPPDKQVSLKDLMKNPSLGRTSFEQITFSERGNLHGLQFYSVAGKAYERALNKGLGTRIPTDQFLQTIRN